MSTKQSRLSHIGRIQRSNWMGNSLAFPLPTVASILSRLPASPSWAGLEPASCDQEGIPPCPPRLICFPTATHMASHKSVKDLNCQVNSKRYSYLLQQFGYFYILFGPGFGVRDLPVEDNEWGWGILLNLGTSILISNHFTLNLEISGIFQNNEYENLSDIILSPSFNLGFLF